MLCRALTWRLDPEKEHWKLLPCLRIFSLGFLVEKLEEEGRGPQGMGLMGMDVWTGQIADPGLAKPVGALP